MPSYTYGQQINLDDANLWDTVSQGWSFSVRVRMPNGRFINMNVVRQNDDPENTARMNAAGLTEHIVIPTEGAWVQVPGTPTDVMTTGDLMTGVMEFREHTV